MLAVLLYAYCTGERSSRRIERRLSEDVAFRVVTANCQLDHATLARFRRHANAIGELFAKVLGLCVAEGLVESRVVSIEGTKIEAATGWLAFSPVRGAIHCLCRTGEHPAAELVLRVELPTRCLRLARAVQPTLPTAAILGALGGPGRGAP